MSFASFRLSPALEATLAFAGWRGGFTEADRERLRLSAKRGEK